MVTRMFAGLFIVLAVVTLGYLAIFRSAMKAPHQDDTHQPPTPRVIRTPAARILLLGNLITAAVYVLLYGFAAGAFN